MTETAAVGLDGPLTAARFVDRPNRFVVLCRLEDDPADGPVEAHLPDPGRLRELLVPGARLWLRPARRPGRRTRWSAALVETGADRVLVSLDTTLPNRLVKKALEADTLDELAGWRLMTPEWTHRGSRFDFLLGRDGDGERLVLEVKSVTLVEDGCALFPDAVTSRGARHLRELADLSVRPGWNGAVLFVLQRPDARRIRAARSIDPRFADALRTARSAGVRVLGRRCRVRRDAVTLLTGPVPVE